MIVRFFYEGGPSFMTPVYLMWIIVFFLAIRFVLLYRNGQNPQKLKRTNDGILFVGSFAFLVGITGQIFGLMSAFSSVQRMGEAGIEPNILAGGLKSTFIAPFCGILLLLLSAILWFVFRNLSQTNQ